MFATQDYLVTIQYVGVIDLFLVSILCKSRILILCTKFDYLNTHIL